MMVFSLFEFILGIKRYSFLGFSYNHWYDKWIKSWFLQTFSKSFFFLLVGLGHATSSLAWPPRHFRLLWRYPPWDFFFRPEKNGARYAGCFGDCSAQSRPFEGSTSEQVYGFANFALVMLGFWAPLAFHNCWGIQFSDGIIIILSINVKELLPSVVRDGWMIDSNIRYVTQGGALNRLRFCTHSHIAILNYNWLLLKELKGCRGTFKIVFYCFWCR